MERLEGAIQHYAWGDRAFIPRLQGRPPGSRPEAELWFGAHPVGPSRLAGSGRSLDEVVAADPVGNLGPELAARSASFPFLLKVLAAVEPLSIQVHPSLAQARDGHAREEAAGLAFDHPLRTYRDPNHKPELLAALTRFEAKCGFRPLAATRELFALLAEAAPTPSLAEVAARLDAGPEADAPAVLARTLGWLLTRPGPEAAALVDDVVAAAEKLAAGGTAGTPAEPFEPELRWTPRLDRHHPGDIGVVVALLLNHVVLQPGQAVYLGAGNLHAYLHGAGVEIMASSDNVVRGGLTPKHVDIGELTRVVDTRPGEAPIQSPVGSAHRYQSPAPEFALSRLVGDRPHRCEPAGPEVVLVTEGEARLVSEATPAAPPVVLGPGQAAFVAFADGPYRIEPVRPGLWWRAGVGSDG